MFQILFSVFVSDSCNKLRRCWSWFSFLPFSLFHIFSHRFLFLREIGGVFLLFPWQYFLFMWRSRQVCLPSWIQITYLWTDRVKAQAKNLLSSSFLFNLTVTLHIFYCLFLYCQCGNLLCLTLPVCDGIYFSCFPSVGHGGRGGQNILFHKHCWVPSFSHTVITRAVMIRYPVGLGSLEQESEAFTISWWYPLIGSYTTLDPWHLLPKQNIDKTKQWVNIEKSQILDQSGCQENLPNKIILKCN